MEALPVEFESAEESTSFFEAPIVIPILTSKNNVTPKSGIPPMFLDDDCTNVTGAQPIQKGVQHGDWLMQTFCCCFWNDFLIFEGV